METNYFCINVEKIKNVSNTQNLILLNYATTK